jgi:hypothetical protein
MVLVNSLFLYIKSQTYVQVRVGRSDLTLQEQAPGAQEQLAQVQPEFPQPPMLMKCLLVVGRVECVVLELI